jgi:2-polyprenyl-3-methyl-5-hydroxy-6-metoxy-1,4-benzoquinol methylase
MEIELPTKETIKSYYDNHLAGKLNGYINQNRRVESAYAEVKKLITKDVRTVIEIGCGIGDISYRIAKQFPSVKVKGLDISEKSIHTAKNLFQRENLSYHCGEIDITNNFGSADLIILIDVYEHIDNDTRNFFNQMLGKLLAKNGKIFLAFPTPEYLAWLKIHDPANIQPVDEDITIAVIADLAKTSHCDVQFYRKKNIWHINDYAHALLDRNKSYANVTPPTALTDRLVRASRKALHEFTAFARKKEINKKLQEQLKRNL